jgi:hypothetical protein
MTQTADPYAQRRHEWLTRVNALADQVEKWSRAEGWEVERENKTIREKLVGEYEVPVLRIAPTGGELHLNPVALHVIGGDGRVDLEAFPTLSRVKLVGENGGWKIMTDSNVPLRRPWDSATFVELAKDLLG